MQTVRTFHAKDGREMIIRPAQPEDSCAIIDTVRSNANERSYVLMEHYGKDPASEREYISELDAAKNLLIVAAMGGGGDRMSRGPSGRRWEAGRDRPYPPRGAASPGGLPGPRHRIGPACLRYRVGGREGVPETGSEHLYDQ